MSQIDLLNKHGMISSEDPLYEGPKKSGLEIALEALRKSNPNSPTIPYLEKQLRRQNEVQNSPAEMAGS